MKNCLRYCKKPESDVCTTRLIKKLKAESTPIAKENSANEVLTATGLKNNMAQQGEISLYRIQ